MVEHHLSYAMHDAISKPDVRTACATSRTSRTSRTSAQVVDLSTHASTFAAAPSDIPSSRETHPGPSYPRPGTPTTIAHGLRASASSLTLEALLGHVHVRDRITAQTEG